MNLLGRGNRGAHFYRHGLAALPEYGIWAGMIQRCTNPKRDRYERYGGRGIRVCDRWLESVTWFMIDMGPRPTELHTIERLDNDGDYEPGNCVWATQDEQRRNRSQSKNITVNGVTKTQQEWARERGVDRGTIAGRLAAGWSEESAVDHAVILVAERERDPRGRWKAQMERKRKELSPR